MARDFHEDDQGKQVMTADGDFVGTVENISGSQAYVKPDPGLAQGTRRKLGWTQEGEDTYPLRKSKVDRIDDDGIHLKSAL